MAERKLIKNVNDFVIGLALLVLGIYVVFTDDIIQGNIANVAGGPLVRPDMYVRLIGGLMAFFAAILVIKAVNFTGRAETKGFHFVLSREVVLSVAGLIIYALILPLVGFGISTFLLIFFLTTIYTRKEKSGEGKPAVTRKEMIRDMIIAAVFSALLDLVVYLLFSHVLHVALP